MMPFRLTPFLVEKPWGGRRLADIGRALPGGALVGESWDLADLGPDETTQPDPVTRVVDGPNQGRTLAEVIAVHGTAFLGTAAPTEGGRFPLLVKHLDARQHLSVQVHPPAAMVARRPQFRLKTESWVVIAAEPGGELMLGVTDGVTRADLRSAAGTGAIVPMLRRVPAVVGEVHHLPAGLIHALGAGVMVAEVQTPSDTTFRFYDWTEEYGRMPRDLHVERALEAIEESWDVNVARPQALVGDGVLVASPHYTVARHRSGTGSAAIDAQRAPWILLVLDGHVAVDALPAAGPGGVVVVPADSSVILAPSDDAVWLAISLP